MAVEQHLPQQQQQQTEAEEELIVNAIVTVKPQQQHKQQEREEETKHQEEEEAREVNHSSAGTSAIRRTSTSYPKTAYPVHSSIKPIVLPLDQENNNSNGNANGKNIHNNIKGSDVIRRRLLQKLGIPLMTTTAVSITNNASNGMNSTNTTAATTSLSTTNNVVTRPSGSSFREALKGDYGQQWSYQEEQSSRQFNNDDDDTQDQPPKPKVSFDKSVRVQPIASHTSYSQRIKPTLWSSTKEIQENAARNAFEFQAEGWHWQGVLEEDDMYFYQGEYVHPAHFITEDDQDGQEEGKQ